MTETEKELDELLSFDHKYGEYRIDLKDYESILSMISEPRIRLKEIEYYIRDKSKTHAKWISNTCEDILNKFFNNEVKTVAEEIIERYDLTKEDLNELKKLLK